MLPVQHGVPHIRSPQATPDQPRGATHFPVHRVQQIFRLSQPAAEPHPETPESQTLHLLPVRPGVCAAPPPAATLTHTQGNEGPQVRGVFERVHPVCQPEEAHADTQQCSAFPVSRLLQELHPETDSKDPHDCASSCEAFQMQGLWQVLQSNVQPPGPYAPPRWQ